MNSADESARALARLLDKFDRMLALRHGEVLPADVPREMRALARMFPGSLRYVDDVPLAIMQARRAELATHLANRAEPLPWMQRQTAFHTHLRIVLALKRGGAHAQEERAGIEARHERDETEAWLSWSNRAAEIAAPPEGKVTTLVLIDLATRLGTTREEIERDIFGDTRRQNRRAR